MKFKKQKSVTDKITSNNLNSMGFNSFVYEVYVEKSGLRSVLKRYWLRHIKICGIFCAFTVLICQNCLNVYIWAALKSNGNRHDSRSDNNAREIIRYFIDVQKRAKFVGVISSHAQIPNPIFFLRVHCNGKRVFVLFTYRKYCYYFPSRFYSKV